MMRRTKKSADTSTPPSSGKSKTASSSNGSPPETMKGTKERPLYIDESMQNFFTVEEGYGSSDDCELSEDYKSPLAGAPSYHSYLSIVPDDDEEDIPDEGSGCPKPGGKQRSHFFCFVFWFLVSCFVFYSGGNGRICSALLK